MARKQKIQKFQRKNGKKTKNSKIPKKKWQENKKFNFKTLIFSKLSADFRRISPILGEKISNLEIKKREKWQEKQKFHFLKP
jgi:hypothetical protein